MSEKAETIPVITSEETRAWTGLTHLDISVLGDNIQRFLLQMEQVLAKAPGRLGEFRFEQIEVAAEISGTGTLALLGTGGQASAKGGLKFVFRRETDKPQP